MSSGASSNAFDVLMKRKTPPTTNGSTASRSSSRGGSKSRFVLCPAGCGTHVLEIDIHLHLDQCIPKGGDPAKIFSPSQPSTELLDQTMERPSTTAQLQTDNQGDKDIQQRSQSPSSAADDEDTPKMQANHQQEAQHVRSKPLHTSNYDAFAHMMKQSHRVFSSDGLPPLRQRFHLHLDGQVSWTDMPRTSPSFLEANEQNQTHTDPEIVRWSAVVKLRGSRMVPATELDSEDIPRDLELTVSSSIPAVPLTPTGSKRRLVRSHSWLSVPVLKSILQKSIRRRRPLPAVRVSMELADKSLGDLLRRLPIIMLEDSTLHPKLPFVVWLMVAESKGFVLPPQHFDRVLQTVYEIASCPWIDTVKDVELMVPGISNSSGRPSGESTHVDFKDPFQHLSNKIYLCSPLQRWEQEFTSTPANSELLIRSMLLRAQYGGMACDMKMIDQFVQLWRRRFFLQFAPEDIVQLLSPGQRQVIVPNGSLTASRKGKTEEQKTQLKWCNVPELVHESAKKQSANQVTGLCTNGLDKLLLKDICIAGIDFHCSAVLDNILSDTKLFSSCCERLSLIMDQVGSSPMPRGAEQRRSWVLHVLKDCMWTFSSGVNYRRPLSLSNDETEDSMHGEKERLLKKFWEETISPSAQNFMKKYAEARLSK